MQTPVLRVYCAPEEDRSLHALRLPARTTESPYTRAFDGYFGAPIRDLLATSELRRLNGICQLSARFTGAGVRLTDSRLSHSLDVSELAFMIATRLELPHHERQLTAAAALLHDACHPTFNHAGEEILQAVFGVAYDHDEEVLSLLRDPRSEVHQVLADGGINPFDTADILDDTSENRRHMNFIVKEVADRLAYLKADVTLSCLADDVVQQVLANRKAVLESLVMIDGRVCCCNVEAFGETLGLRRRLYREVSCSPAASIVKRVLIRGLGEAAEAGKVTATTLVRGTEFEVLDLLPPQYRQMLHQGVDNALSIVVVGATGKNLPAYLLRTLELELELDVGSHVFLGVTPNYSKSVSLIDVSDGTAVQRLIHEAVPDSDRFVTLAIPPNLPSVEVAAISNKLRKNLNQLLGSGSFWIHQSDNLRRAQ